MKYRDLLEELKELTPEQLDSDVTIELVESEEVFSSTNGDVDFKIATETDIIDEDHPIILVNA